MCLELVFGDRVLDLFAHFPITCNDEVPWERGRDASVIMIGFHQHGQILLWNEARAAQEERTRKAELLPQALFVLASFSGAASKIAIVDDVISGKDPIGRKTECPQICDLLPASNQCSGDETQHTTFNGLDDCKSSGVLKSRIAHDDD